MRKTCVVLSLFFVSLFASIAADGRADIPFVSPNGKWVAVEDVNHGGVTVSGISRLHPRRYTDQSGLGHLVAYPWSPDSTELLMSEIAPDRAAYRLLSLDTGVDRVLQLPGDNPGAPAVLSPSGRYVAFSVVPPGSMVSNRLAIWDTRDASAAPGAQTTRFPLEIRAVSWLNDTHLLIAGGYARTDSLTLSVLRIPSGKIERTFTVPGRMHAIAPYADANGNVLLVTAMMKKRYALRVQPNAGRVLESVELPPGFIRWLLLWAGPNRTYLWRYENRSPVDQTKIEMLFCDSGRPLSGVPKHIVFRGPLSADAAGRLWSLQKGHLVSMPAPD